MVLKNINENNLQAIIARAPDFFGGTSRANSVLINLVYDKFISGKKAQWLCNVDKIHSFGYVPELAKGTAMLGNTEKAYNQIWNLPTDSHKITGKGWIELFAKELKCDLKYSVLPNWLIKGIGIFVPIMSEIAEMNYQYDRDYYFDSFKFNDFFLITSPYPIHSLLAKPLNNWKKIMTKNKQRTANKQIGNRADEMLLLSFCAKLNGSNSIQHLC